MKIKPTRHRYFGVVILAFLAACGQQAAALPPETPIPTAVSPTPVPTSTFIPVTDSPTPLPTLLPTRPTIPMITPDAIQVERWKEYEDALAKRFLAYLPQEEVICEWEILGRSDQEIYVWVICMGTIGIGTLADPAVIQLGIDGSAEDVEIPRGGSNYASDIREMFPPDAEEKYFEELIHFQELIDHLNWRREHPEEPPLIVLSSTPMP